MKRNPIYAGTFYPGESVILRADIEHYLSRVTLTTTERDILGIISPHAGYIYSGQCAAFGYKALSFRHFTTAVIIAPSHRYGHFRFSVGNFEAYLTPLGEVRVDHEIVTKLLSYPEFSFHPIAHNSEHSLEVQIPFLQVIKDKVRIVPILLGNQTPENSVLLADILYNEFKDKMAETIFIISSDLSHYHPAPEAESMDGKLLDYLRSLDTDKMVKAIYDEKIEACGYGGILTILNLCRKFNYTRNQILNYTHSGKVTGDNYQVVGYSSAAFFR